jgi:hypothetical protein
MDVIRQFAKVKNHQLNITLPNDFGAEDVEVIIISNSKEFLIPQWQIDEVRKRSENYLKNPESAIKYEDF